MGHGERLNTITHLFAAVLAFVGSAVLLYFALTQSDPVKVVSFLIYGLCTVGLFCASTLYHGSMSERKNLFRKLDHVGIYLKIAGGYTPFMLITLKGFSGWSILSLVWFLAGLGVVQELIIGHRTRRWSFLIYGIMAGSSILVMDELARKLPMIGFASILLGYLFFVIGFVFFIYDTKIKHGHAIWHVCVLVGSTLQFFCLLKYVV